MFKDILQKLTKPKSEREVYLRPFLMMVISFLALVIAMVVNANKATEIKVPENMALKVDGNSNVTFDKLQFAELVDVLRQPKPADTVNVIVEPTKPAKANKKRKKRWHKAGWY